MRKEKRPQKPKSQMPPERVKAIQERRRSNAAGIHMNPRHEINWKKEWDL